MAAKEKLIGMPRPVQSEPFVGQRDQTRKKVTEFAVSPVGEYIRRNIPVTAFKSDRMSPKDCKSEPILGRTVRSGKSVEQSSRRVSSPVGDHIRHSMAPRSQRKVAFQLTGMPRKIQSEPFVEQRAQMKKRVSGSVVSPVGEYIRRNIPVTAFRRDRTVKSEKSQPKLTNHAKVKSSVQAASVPVGKAEPKKPKRILPEVASSPVRAYIRNDKPLRRVKGEGFRKRCELAIEELGQAKTCSELFSTMIRVHRELDFYDFPCPELDQILMDNVTAIMG